MTYISTEKRFVYDEAHYSYWAVEMLLQGGNNALMERISHRELLCHISTVFYTSAQSNSSSKLKGVDIEINVGKESGSLQSLMRERGIKGIVGLTPKFPIQNPNATDAQNDFYVRSFQRLLSDLRVDYVPAKGRAKDFREGGDGCFLLVDVSPQEVMSLLEINGEPTQLSITYLPPTGKAQLLSCIEPKPKENRIKAILKNLSHQERATALSFLGAVIAGAERSSATSPLLMEFMFCMERATPECRIKLVGVLARLLENPNLLK
jgi:hypothetical protein